MYVYILDFIFQLSSYKSDITTIYHLSLYITVVLSTVGIWSLPSDVNIGLEIKITLGFAADLVRMEAICILNRNPTICRQK